MGVLEELLQQIKKEIIEAICKEAGQSNDEWLDKKQLAKYWQVSTKWIELHLDEIPHSKIKPWRFKKSVVDAWRMGDKEEIKVVRVASYNKNNFKVDE